MRLACVQNGDYTLAANRLAAGGTETYNGQFYSVAEFQRLVGNRPHLVISLDAPDHEVKHEAAEWVGLPARKSILGLPRRLAAARHARRVIQRLERFGPTHLLLRCVDVIGCDLLEWARRRQIKVAAIVAARFDQDHSPCSRFCRLGNDANVMFVANHNRVATDTMIACGLNPCKAIAWDLPPSVAPDKFASRTRDVSAPLKLLFAGAVEPAKGVEDFVEAARLYRAGGRAVEATVCGDGPLCRQLSRHPGVAEGWLRAPGLVPQHEIVDRMRLADFLVVPSRKEFPEGLPFVIQEGLAVRTPLLLSDHPIFVNYFRDGEGVRFFKQKRPESLAALCTELSANAEAYAELSRKTSGAWHSIQCPTKFHHLLQRLGTAWEPAPAPDAELLLVS